MNDSAVTVKTTGDRWLLLIHQIPPKPDYFRVKVRRRLQRMGAVALKNSVYVLPNREQASEDFRWLLREIEAEGGEATLCEASFIEGMTTAQLVAVFTAERDAEYGQIGAAAQQLASGWSSTGERERASLEVDLGRLRRQLEEIKAIDYFQAGGAQAADRALRTVESRLSRPVHKASKGVEQMQGQVWVTRKDVYIDRIGCSAPSGRSCTISISRMPSSLGRKPLEWKPSYGGWYEATRMMAPAWRGAPTCSTNSTHPCADLSLQRGAYISGGLAGGGQTRCGSQDAEASYHHMGRSNGRRCLRGRSPEQTGSCAGAGVQRAAVECLDRGPQGGRTADPERSRL
ncbi:MAG: hypothetical protein K0S19_1860 [Geminicoccaceae bacterium]|nr:hypothetical protein [Geminicoccaceae bacterium]